MKLSLRFILPLFVVLLGASYFVTPLFERLTLQWFYRDLEIRSKLVAGALEESVGTMMEEGNRQKVLGFLNRVTQDERLFAVRFCSKTNLSQVETITFPKDLDCKMFLENEGKSIRLENPSGPLLASTVPIAFDGKAIGDLVFLHDLSFVERRSAVSKKYIFYIFSALALLVSIITVVIAQLSWRGWLAGTRALLKGEGFLKPLSDFRNSEFLPIAKDLKSLILSLERDRRLKDETRISWSPKALKNILKENLAGDEILIVSNREPYIHVKKESGIEVQFPASGLVTALEPIMRACSGTWIAHGSGSADRLTVDANDRVRVPPEKPAYSIRRVWLTKEQEEGYYYGLANEGIWPLCHIAHTRPIFRSSDWKMYKEVNEKFAEIVEQESKTKDPVILVQDYHFALLPKLIKERLPQATVISFWHIPWPNPEAFGICPWRNEILEGLLGSTILGFHTQFHCNNFLETVDRYLETRIDREQQSVQFQGKATAVREYPISIEWPNQWLDTNQSISDCRLKVRTRHGLATECKIAVGVDRMDYTKGILERFRAVERMLELYPEWRKKFVLIQIAAPTRSNITQYQNFESEVRALAERINKKFGEGEYLPILLLAKHHEPKDVTEYFRASDLCIVSSLHDGMNLVAKEFVSCREDEAGVLLLSQFTGASRELPEALIINPYHIDQFAQAIYLALTMPKEEQKERMRSMRALVQEFNVYRWAGKMLLDAANFRRRSRLLTKVKETESLMNQSDGL